MLATITKVENQWDVVSIYELMYYHCPSCNYQINQKQKFVDHACKSHPEVIENLKNIKDGSLDDVIFPWDSNHVDFGNDISTEIADSAIDLIKIEEDDLEKYNEISEKDDVEKCNEISNNITNKIPKHLQVSLLQQKKKPNVTQKFLNFGNSKKSPVLSFACSSCTRQIPRTELKAHFAMCRKAKSAAQIKSKAQGILNNMTKSQVENVSCEICGKIVKGLKKLERHKAISHESCFCEKCGKEFENKNKLRLHDNRIHREKNLENTVSKVFKCDDCDKVFKRKKSLNLHKKGFHEGKKEEMCVQCGRCFLHKQVLQNHIKAVHEGRKDHKCKHCGKDFSDLGNMRRHVMTVHEGLKPYQCSHCSIAYGQSNDLKRHIQKVHFKNI